MKIILNRHITPPPPKPMTIQAFADEHDLTMEISERAYPDTPNHRFWASFKGVEVVKGKFLAGEHGNGAKPEDAVVDYVHCISEKNLRLPNGTKLTAPAFKIVTNLLIP